MNRIALKVQELEKELEEALTYENALNDKKLSLDKMQEDIKAQNMQQVKTADDLAHYQSDVKKFEANLNERERQISIKEKALTLMQASLKDEKDTLRRKEEEITSRDLVLARKEKEFADWEGKVRLAEQEVDEQRILNQKDKVLDEIRKTKLASKEEEIQRNLERVKNMSI